MASNLTPEELAELRTLSQWGRVTMAGDTVGRLVDMAERCADYDRRLTEVMPADFKDWHQNSRREWPEVAASTITNLRERLEQAEEASVDAERVAIERSQDA